MVNQFDPQKSIAILIGASKYGNDFEDIPQIKDNISELERTLRRKQIFGLHQKDILTILDKDDDETEEEVDTFVQKAIDNGKTTLLLYFAGHGFKHNLKGEDKFFLIFKNSKKRTIKRSGNSALDYETLKTIIDLPELKQKIILLDVCNSGQINPSDIYPDQGRR